MRFLRNIGFVRVLAVLLVATTGLMSFSPYLADRIVSEDSVSANDTDAQPEETAGLAPDDPEDGSLLYDFLSRALADEVVRQAVLTSAAAPLVLNKSKATAISPRGAENLSRLHLPVTALVVAVPMLSELIASLSAARPLGP